jgi:hypothetical protein
VPASIVCPIPRKTRKRDICTVWIVESPIVAVVIGFVSEERAGVVAKASLKRSVRGNGSLVRLVVDGSGGLRKDVRDLSGGERAAVVAESGLKRSGRTICPMAWGPAKRKLTPDAWLAARASRSK